LTGILSKKNFLPVARTQGRSFTGTRTMDYYILSIRHTSHRKAIPRWFGASHGIPKDTCWYLQGTITNSDSGDRTDQRTTNRNSHRFLILAAVVLCLRLKSLNILKIESKCCK
jgi:hypothetical protein